MVLRLAQPDQYILLILYKAALGTNPSGRIWHPDELWDRRDPILVYISIISSRVLHRIKENAHVIFSRMKL